MLQVFLFYPTQPTFFYFPTSSYLPCQYSHIVILSTALLNLWPPLPHPSTFLFRTPLLFLHTSSKKSICRLSPLGDLLLLPLNFFPRYFSINLTPPDEQKYILFVIYTEKTRAEDTSDECQNLYCQRYAYGQLFVTFRFNVLVIY